MNDKTVREVMIPAGKIAVLDFDAPQDEILQKIVRTGHSRFPVRSAEKSDIVGTVYVKDIFGLMAKRKNISLKKILRPAHFVAEDDKIDGLLRCFQREGIHQVIVLDSKGGISGLITLEDVLEELVGYIRDDPALETRTPLFPE